MGRDRSMGSGLRLVRHRKGFEPIVLRTAGVETTAGEPNGEQADSEQTQLLTTRDAHSKYRSRRSQQVIDVCEKVGEQAQLLPSMETSTMFRSRSWQEVVYEHYAQLEMAAAGSRRRQQAAREGASRSGPGTRRGASGREGGATSRSRNGGQQQRQQSARDKAQKQKRRSRSGG